LDDLDEFQCDFVPFGNLIVCNEGADSACSQCCAKIAGKTGTSILTSKAYEHIVGEGSGGGSLISHDSCNESLFFFIHFMVGKSLVNNCVKAATGRYFNLQK